MLYNAALGQKAPKTPDASITITPKRKASEAILLDSRYYRRAHPFLQQQYRQQYLSIAGCSCSHRSLDPGETSATSLHETYVGSGKLRYQTGITSRTVRTMELSKVQDVRVQQSFMDRILDLGTISIETAGETSRINHAWHRRAAADRGVHPGSRPQITHVGKETARPNRAGHRRLKGIGESDVDRPRRRRRSRRACIARSPTNSSRYRRNSRARR